MALHFLDERRRNLPYGEDQLQLLIRVVRYFRPEVWRIVDLGCGDGVVARTLLSAYPDPSAVLIDHSLPMLSRAEEAMARRACYFRFLELAVFGGVKKA